MKWLYTLLVSLILVFIISFQTPALSSKKEKRLFISLIVIDWIIAVVLIFYPSLPSPYLKLIPLSDYIHKILK